MKQEKLYEQYKLPPLAKDIFTVEEWEAERAAQLQTLENEMLGHTPDVDLSGMRFETVQEAKLENGCLARHMRVILPGRNGSETAINGWLFLPAKLEKPVPVFVHVGFMSPYDFETGEMNTRFFPVQTLLDRGYAALTYRYADAAPDEPDYTTGLWESIYGAPEEHNGNCWSAIRVWGWAASRMLDYLTTLPEVDEKKAAIVGHSRLGKTALWAGAMDKRFALVISKDSGSGGAALLRSNTKETVADLNRKFPHWFTPNFSKWDDKEYDMPFDAHTMLSMVAPRHLYVSGATDDPWADPVLEFAAESAVTGVYRLYGFNGLDDADMPSADKPLYGDHMAYHIRTGGHSLVAQDFTWYCDYADMIFG